MDFTLMDSGNLSGEKTGLPAFPPPENTCKSGLVVRYDRLFWRRCAVKTEREEVRQLLGGLRYLSRAAKKAVLSEYDGKISELSCRLAKTAREIDGGEDAPWII